MAKPTVTIHQTTNGYYFIENNIKYLNVKHERTTMADSVRSRIETRPDIDTDTDRGQSHPSPPKTNSKCVHMEANDCCEPETKVNCNKSL